MMNSICEGCQDLGNGCDYCLKMEQQHERKHKPIDYWENVCKLAAKQRAKGISSYGQPLEWNQIPSVIERIDYQSEELVDALMYNEWVKEGLLNLMEEMKNGRDVEIT